MFVQPTAAPSVESIDPGVLASAVGGVVLLSLLGAAVRSRPVGALCRMGALVCATYPALAVWSAWRVDDPTGMLRVPQPAAAELLLGRSLELPSLPDLGQMRAPTGLETSLLAFALALVAFFLLSLRMGRSAR